MGEGIGRDCILTNEVFHWIPIATSEIGTA